MTEKRKTKEIKKRILLRGRLRNISAGDAAALLTSLVAAIHEPRVGFNHATTDIAGWLGSIAPYGMTLDDAFIEDMLYACNLLNEIKKYKHPQGKTFEETLKTILKPGEAFDLETNEIKGRKR
jgi:hypothetical protein